MNEQTIAFGALGRGHKPEWKKDSATGFCDKKMSARISVRNINDNGVSQRAHVYSVDVGSIVTDFMEEQDVF